MALDRYGEPKKECRNPNCQSPGWLGYDAEGRLIPCPECKEHLFDGSLSRDPHVERPISARAAAAIERDEDNQESR